MKVRSIINTQIEFIEEMSEEDFKIFNSNEFKSKTKLIIKEVLQKQIKADEITVKSYRLEKENEKNSKI